MKMLERDFDPDQWPSGSPEKNYVRRTAYSISTPGNSKGTTTRNRPFWRSVLLQLGEHKRFGPKVRNKVVSLLKSVNRMRLATLGLKHISLPAAATFLTGVSWLWFRLRLLLLMELLVLFRRQQKAAVSIRCNRKSIGVILSRNPETPSTIA